MELEQVLLDQGIPYDRLTHPPVYTSQALAAVEHVSGHCVAKPVIVSGSGGFAMCVVPACSHVDLQHLRQVLGDPSVHLATEDEMAKLCPDCELGAEPPIGKFFGLPTLMDQALAQEEFLVFQTGTHTESVKMRRDDYERVASPRVEAIARP